MSGENCLTGMKVLDLTQFEAGPSCTEALAWMGADVVKIENPKSGDPGRTAGGKPGQDANYFLQYNANKRSVAVNSDDPRGARTGRRTWRKQQADIMVENFASWRRWSGLGWVSMSSPALEPRHHLLSGQRLRHRQPAREKCLAFRR